jgi:hypothetical protein
LPVRGPAIFLAQFASARPPFDVREGAPFIRSHMIRKTTQAFDDFAASSTDPKVHARILGLDQR